VFDEHLVTVASAPKPKPASGRSRRASLAVSAEQSEITSGYYSQPVMMLPITLIQTSYPLHGRAVGMSGLHATMTGAIIELTQLDECLTRWHNDSRSLPETKRRFAKVRANPLLQF